MNTRNLTERFIFMNCSFNEFRISRILLRPINGAGLIVEAASRKPKELVLVGMKELNEIRFSYLNSLYIV